MMTRYLKRYLLIASGTVALVLGLIGMAVPVLPTTPFLLLAAGCYMRSSRRLYDWLLRNRLFGPTIRNYLMYRAVRSRTRTIAMFVLWGSLLLSIILVNRLTVRLLLLLVGLGVSWHLATLRTLAATAPGEQTAHPDKRERSDNSDNQDRSEQRIEPEHLSDPDLPSQPSPPDPPADPE